MPLRLFSTQMMHDQQPGSTSTFDYVVVGTGAAGAIVCARLSEDPGVTVCALESGPPDRPVYSHSSGFHQNRVQ